MDTLVKKPFDSTSTITETKDIPSNVHRSIKCVLIILNSLQVFLGLTCCVGCLFVRFDKVYIKRLVRTYLMPVVADLMRTFSGSDYGIGYAINAYNTTEVLRWVALVFLVMTFILLLPALFGISGLCSKRSWLMTTYIVVTGVLVIAKIALIVLCYIRPDVIQDWIRTPLKVSLQTTYRGDTATDPVSVTWNLLMIKFSCCGVDNGRDFEFSRFNRDFTLQIFNQTLSISNLQTPLACCNSASRRTTFEPGACAKYPIRKDHTHYFEGCLEKIWSYVTQYSDAFILAAVVICSLEALQVILTCVFMELLKREMEDRKQRKSRTYRKGSDFFFPSVSEESLM
ncbi:CD63 antigen [Magallana gigas]|uniref:CD63 antigen n=1 Tax=Magallana gigas TaxID=29159 RepID=UPI0033410C1A